MIKKFPWFQHYPDSVPYNINPDKYESLIHLFDYMTQQHDNMPMLRNMGRVFTYRKFNDQSKRFAAYLQQHPKLKTGDAVAIQMPNLIQYLVVFTGIIRAGMIVVNINPLYTPREMLHQLKDSCAKAIVILENFAHNLETIINDTNLQVLITTRAGDMLGRFRGTVVNFVVKHIKKMVPDYNLPNEISLRQILLKTSPLSYSSLKISRSHPALLQYTGGTTGISKGAILTHRNLLANLEQSASFMKDSAERGKDIAIIPLPLYHIFALTATLSFLNIGVLVVLITNPIDLKGFIKEMKKERFEWIIGVNSLYQALMSKKGFAKIDFSTLKVAFSAGVSLQKSVREKWDLITGKKNTMIEAYGMTETSPMTTSSVPSGIKRDGTVGIPVPNTQVKIVDQKGEEVPYETRGEIWIHGPQVMKGYWKNPEETKKAFNHGWLKTGDIGVMSPDGVLTIVDRKKDMINVSGFNVFPNEVEEFISQNHKVLESCAISATDNLGQEYLCLVAVKKDPSLTRNELKSYCSLGLAHYKVPKRIIFVDSLPKSPIGKVLRREVRDKIK